MSPASGNTISPHHVEESYQGRTVDALASSAEEGRGTLRKASGSRVQALYPGMSEWGNPPLRRKTRTVSAGEHIAGGREPGELKHLSTQRKRDHSASSGERTRNSPNRASGRGCRSGRRTTGH